MVILTFSLVDMFDTVGTLVGTAQKANLIGTMETLNMNKSLDS